MKPTVLARPNLKLFVLGAVLIALITHVVFNAHSQGPLLAQARVSIPDLSSEAYLQALLQQAAVAPSSEVLTRLSGVYERRGEFKKALFFLRQAEKAADAEEKQ